MQLGSYAEARLIKAERLVPLPSDIDDEHAAAMMLKGLTAQYLLHTSYPVKRGDTVLVHAAAGGVGQLLCQWAKAIGATVIGTVSGEEKAAVARSYGCDHPILYTQEDFAERTKALTDGRGVDVIYDSVGQDTVEKGFGCLAPLGSLVSYGQSSGPVKTIDTGLLRPRSLSFATAGLANFIATREALLSRATSLFEAVRSGAVRVDIARRYPLAEVVEAHRALQGRQTTGTSILLP
jgi:NADPH2:quinone reductase